MFDRTFLPALTFTLLVAALSAFAGEFVPGGKTQPQVVQLERVVVTAQRQLSATPVASIEASSPIVR